ncbi:CaiB/BaiF CoA transferase family protein [Amycolatopsis echigonensis]|uniref:CoA transferase n=1 Tax=Amycolatopsis echigonensis TaxID=2576905 RepID=A0A8E2B945_9PSEU|nr:CaiB/BaiF CoA-transferase family protein [Amycolatopsis echigonensis]MBB2503643.1 CoA transferase [Amycolatopsis echigonensis]
MTAWTEHPGALGGLRVLDLSRILSGPFCTMTLADLGADVIKVEDARGGDDTRAWGPPFQGDTAAYFLSVNRNKRGIAIDLKDPDCRQLLWELAATADVVVENFRPGTAARLGFGYDDVAGINPRVVYASISGYGQTGPMSGEAGYDAIAQALSGVMSVTGEADGPPVRFGVSGADLAAGMWATVGILAALHERERTGRGQWVDVSLLDGQISWLTYVASGYFATGVTPGRYGSAHPTIVPYQAFPTADGHLMVAAGNDGLWRRFASAVGLGDLVDDPRFATNPDRVRHREELIQLIEEALEARSAQEWAKILAEAGVPVGPINTVGEALEHPQVVARGMVTEVEHPSAGTVRAVGSPVKLSASPPQVRTPPPGHGQHTDDVLSALGADPELLAALRSRGALR